MDILRHFFVFLGGVRQGCPLSPYLFILCADILAICINRSPVARGISVSGNEIKILQYADDTTIFVDGTANSLRTIVDIFEAEASSGLKVNYDKTNIFPLGPLASAKPTF